MKRFFSILLLMAVFLLLAIAAPEAAPQQQCRAFLEKQGWKMAEAFSEEPVTLPEAGDETWDAYLALQRENGFDMEEYSRKTVLRLSCRIQNHPGGEQVYANLYWCDGRIIGGDIMSPALDGFMHGLRNSSF